ncbi:MAG: Glu/Leu/Phe/Val dehydrogenase dimerization domain-containing protein [Phycisphaerales bacterium]
MPESLHTFFCENGEVLGHLVIDSSIGGLSGGGIRMVPGTSVKELCYLARAMTWKYSFLQWPYGGAKAAIAVPGGDLTAQKRQERIELFARRLAAFRGRYMPGEDAGTNTDDLNLIRRIAHLDRAGPRTLDSSFHTALTLRICAEQIVRELKLDPTTSTVAIEGFGKVGGWVARQLREIGCRVVAVSTSKGAIHHADGLDIDRLLQARESHGDDCVAQYKGARRIEREQLVSVQADLLVPCALSWSITSANVGEIQARVILCGANNPVTEKAKGILAAKGVMYFPDFVSNSGGVLGSIIETLCMDHAKAVAVLREVFEPKAERVLSQARSTGQSLEAAARAIATENRRRMQQRAETVGGKPSSWLGAAYQHGLLPRRLVKMFGASYIRKAMT